MAMVRLMRTTETTDVWWEVVLHGWVEGYRRLWIVDWDDLLGRFVWAYYKRLNGEGIPEFGCLYFDKRRVLKKTRRIVGGERRTS